MEIIKIRTDFIQLDQFLKWCGAVQTGGEAKHLITNGAIQLNGVTETRRGKKLYPGDIISVDNRVFTIAQQTNVD